MKIYAPDFSTSIECPLFIDAVSAGFPSPAEDYVEGKLDLNKYLIKHPAATFFVRVTGDSMLDAGIHTDDILIVDRSLEPADKKVVIAIVDGELTIKRFRVINGKVCLLPENKDYEPIELNEDSEVEIWGVVTNVIHPV